VKEQVERIQKQGLEQLVNIRSLSELTELRVGCFGKKSELTTLSRAMGALSKAERPVMGQLINDVRRKLEEVCGELEQQLKHDERQAALLDDAIDVTLPGRKPGLGSEHPLMRTIREIQDIFVGLGFEVVEGPEVEWDYYNFEALNLPKNHPARDMQDTFYITEEILMRTQTSPVQIRTMEQRKPEVPLRIIHAGRVYRRDDDDATHSHAFMQLEALVVDRGVRMSDLKGTLLAFARQMFGPEQQIRLRPSFFPFTEPSAEVDITCILCRGSGCRVCKNTGWIEILGAGMVHPRVLSMAGYDSEQVQGFAVGMGIERVAMLKYGIEDIRTFYTNDIRFLRQFSSKW